MNPERLPPHILLRLGLWRRNHGLVLPKLAMPQPWHSGIGIKKSWRQAPTARDCEGGFKRQGNKQVIRMSPRAELHWVICLCALPLPHLQPCSMRTWVANQSDKVSGSDSHGREPPISECPPLPGNMRSVCISLNPHHTPTRKVL